MNDVRDALLFLELDKGGEAPGPLFEEPRRRLESDPRLRAGWSQYQALRALGWECAPEPGEKLLRQALLNCRREKVNRQLARSTGSDDLAREILLGRVKERRGLPGWVLGALLLGALGLGWIAFGRSFMDFQKEPPAAAPAPGPSAASPGDEPLPFEFSAQTTPADAALSAPPSDAVNDKADDMRHEDAASRQARLMLRQHLRGQDRRDPGPAVAAPAPQPTAPPERHAPPVKAVPAAPTLLPQPAAEAAWAKGGAKPLVAASSSPAEKPKPRAKLKPKPKAAATAHKPEAQAVLTPAATQAPTVAPTLVPTATPIPAPTSLPAAAPASSALTAPVDLQADLRLSSPSMAQGDSLLVTVSMPERREIDLRLFDMKGHPVRKLGEGPFGPGQARFPFDGNDDAGQALKPATYYLRVMTPWFSRVEPIEIQ